MRVNVAAPNPSLLTREGAPAKRISDRDALHRAVVTCLLWEDQFYEGGETTAERIRRLTLAVNPTDAAKIASSARNRHHLRHAPLWMACALASGTATQRAVVPSLLADIIQRPDELAEFVALYWKNGRRPLAACVKRGLARAFPKFSAYSLAKYDRDGAVKLRDVMFLVHPKPKDAEQVATWKLLASRSLPAPDTWEVALSKGGDKKAAWERLLADQKLGALALLRNLRNLREAGVSDAVVSSALATVKVDRVLPFRFLAAARYAPTLEPALESAMFRCLAATPKLAGRTALIVDTSPSMWGTPISAKSELDRFDAAAALAVLCREVCADVAVYAFNNKAYEIPARRGFALRDALAATQGGYSCGGLAVAMANTHGYDRIIVLTDGEWHNLSTQTAGPAFQMSPAPLTDKAYLINVAASRNTVGSNKWVMIDGWSEAVLDYIVAHETPLTTD